jgi:acetyl/propionyl-CoA carboxylase alpha subunit
MLDLHTILVANRGEIACRIIRTGKRLGRRMIAVYHHEDRLAPHVAMADQAIELAGAVPTSAYLDAGQVIKAARSAGAVAIHPGYGFLSENESFAEAVTAAGLVFIGPDAQSMRLMGDKLRSREFARAQGVPVAPSFEINADASIETFASAAQNIGYPLLIKASAGGGGKGMRVVRSQDELAQAIPLAAGEASRYFGDARIYAERLVPGPRHIEVQVFGDGKGGVLHLGERECSIQRRFQKIVEEAPSPGLAPVLRDAIVTAAVRLASAARYRNAGTVEFILGSDGIFYFLEMNTRLQVEHPVTECVWGLDLVELQIAVASGAPLPPQESLSPSGHAIEVRICAEEPERDFRPATGKIGLLREPTGSGVRFDSGIREGQAVTPAFDSMLAKLIVHGPDRESVRQRLITALSETTLLGVASNIDYLGRIAAHAAFAEAALHTGFVAEHAQALTAPPGLRESALALAAAAIGCRDIRIMLHETPELHGAIGYWRN